MKRGGLVLLLDEAENIDKQYDIRGRRKSYETLARMTRHPYMLPVVFVTDRLLYQVEQDYKQASDGHLVNASATQKIIVPPTHEQGRPLVVTIPLVTFTCERRQADARRSS
jgi:hypothetical protein